LPEHNVKAIIRELEIFVDNHYDDKTVVERDEEDFQRRSDELFTAQFATVPY
jgi:hypothetical protein